MFGKLFSKAEKQSYHNGVRAGVKKAKSMDVGKHKSISAPKLTKKNMSVIQEKCIHNILDREKKLATNRAIDMGLGGTAKNFYIDDHLRYFENSIKSQFGFIPTTKCNKSTCSKSKSVPLNGKMTASQNRK